MTIVAYGLGISPGAGQTVQGAYAVDGVIIEMADQFDVVLEQDYVLQLEEDKKIKLEEDIEVKYDG